MAEPCVEIEGVTKRFGEDLVLKKVDLILERGRFTVLLETTVPERRFL